MSWSVVALQQVASMPWRNGGGVTRELLAWPDAARWRVRLSVADVERDGPFSRFPGVRRWFAVLAGAGVRLRFADAMHPLTPAGEPLHFDGGAAVDCALIAGPTLDFNLMVQGGGDARMLRVRGAHAGEARAGCLLAAWNNGVQPAALSLGGDALVLAPRALAWRIADADAPVRFACDDGLWMEVGL